jgi:hypothetical protein
MKHIRPFRVLGATAALSVVAVGAVAAPGGAPEIDLKSESAEVAAAPAVQVAAEGEEFPGDQQVADDEVSAPSEPSEPSVQSVSEPSEPSVPSEPSPESVSEPSEPSVPSEPSPESEPSIESVSEPSPESEPSIESVSEPSPDEDDDLD